MSIILEQPEKQKGDILENEGRAEVLVDDVDIESVIFQEFLLFIFKISIFSPPSPCVTRVECFRLRITRKSTTGRSGRTFTMR